MTDDRIFKNKVKEVAELNGLSYTDAKKAVIEANKHMEKLIKEEPLLWEDVFKTEAKAQVFFNNVVIKKPEGKFIKINEIDNIPQYIQLSSFDEDYSIDLQPLNNGMKKGLSNVVKRQTISDESHIARMMFFLFAEQFERNNTYFVDEKNYFTQMPKVLNKIQNADSDEEILVGIIRPNNLKEKTSDSHYEKWSHEERTYRNLRYKMKDAIKDKKVYVISSGEKNPSITNFKTILQQEVQYFPFEKIRGGSYYRSTSKKVLGHVQGYTKFVEPRMTLIEQDNNSCIEQIYEMNKSGSSFVHWKSQEEMNVFVEELSKSSRDVPRLAENLFLRVDFEMNEKDFSKFIKLLSNYSDDYKYFDNKRDDQIVIESPDAERIESYYEDDSEKLKGFAERFTLAGNALYNSEYGMISLYKAP